LTENRLGFAPQIAGDSDYFWSVGGAWGNFSRRGEQVMLTVLYGELRLKTLALGGAALAAAPLISKVTCNGAAVKFSFADGAVVFTPPLTLGAGSELLLA
jgi:hypothetical protein